VNGALPDASSEGGDAGVKRQKISLKLNGAAAKAVPPVEEQGEEGVDEAMEDEHDMEEKRERGAGGKEGVALLSEHVREALSIVIEQ
jgi:hypothetical protein